MEELVEILKRAQCAVLHAQHDLIQLRKLQEQGSDSTSSSSEEFNNDLLVHHLRSQEKQESAVQHLEQGVRMMQQLMGGTINPDQGNIQQMKEEVKKHKAKQAEQQLKMDAMKQALQRYVDGQRHFQKQWEWQLQERLTTKDLCMEEVCNNTADFMRRAAERRVLSQVLHKWHKRATGAAVGSERTNVARELGRMRTTLAKTYGETRHKFGLRQRCFYRWHMRMMRSLVRREQWRSDEIDKRLHEAEEEVQRQHSVLVEALHTQRPDAEAKLQRQQQEELARLRAAMDEMVREFRERTDTYVRQQEEMSKYYEERQSLLMEEVVVGEIRRQQQEKVLKCQQAMEARVWEYADAFCSLVVDCRNEKIDALHCAALSVNKETNQYCKELEALLLQQKREVVEPMKARVEELERRCMEAGVLLDGCNEGLRVREDMILRLRKSLTQQLLQVTQLRQTRSSWDAWRRFTEPRHHKRNLAMHRYDSHQRELMGAEMTYRQCLMRLEASSRKALAAKRSCSYAEVLSRQAVAELSDMADLYASLQKEMAQLKSDSAGLLKKQREQASALHCSRVECVERAEIVERMRLCNGELRSRRELDQIMTEYRAAMTRQKCAALQLRVNNTNDKLQTVGALAAEYCARHAYTRWLLIAERKKHTRQLKITQLPSRPPAASEHKSNQWPQVPITRSDASVQFIGMQPTRLNEATQFSGMQPTRLNEATQFSGMQPTRLNEATQFSGMQPTRLNEATQFSGMQPTRLNEATQFSGMQPTRLNEATQFSGMQPTRLNEATQFSGMQPERLNEATQFSGMQPTRLNEATQFSGMQPERLNEATQFSGMQPERLNEATQFSGMQPERLNEATQFSGIQPERLNEATQFSGMQPTRLNEATQFSGMQPERLNEATQFSGMQPERLNEATQFSGMQPERLNEATQFSGMQPTRLNEATQFSGMQPTRLNEATQFSGMQPTRLNEATQFIGMQPTRLNEATQFSGIQPTRLNEATQFSGMQPTRLNEATQFSGIQPERLNEATQFSGMQPTRLNEATQFSGMQPTRLNEATQFSGMQPERLNEATQFSGMQPERLNEATQFIGMQPTRLNEATQFSGMQPTRLNEATQFSGIQPERLNEATQFSGMQPTRLNEATQFSGMQPTRLNEATQFSGMQPTRLNEATQFSGMQPTRLNEATQFIGMQPTRLNEATQFSGMQPTRLNEATQFSGMQPTRLNEATQFSPEPKAGEGDTHFVSLRSVSCGHVTEDLHRHKSEHGTQCHGQKNITPLVSHASDGAVGVSLVSTACQVGTTQVACALEARHHASVVSTNTVVSSAAPLLEYAMHLAFTGQDALAEHSRAVVDAAWEAAASMLHDRQHAHEVELDELLRYQSFLEDRLVAAEATSGDIRESDQTAARVRQLQEQLENSEAVTRALRLGLERLQLQREQEEKEQKRIESKLAETEGHRSRYEREVEALQRRVGEQWVHTEEVKDKLNVARQRIESLETALKEERHDHEKQLSDLQSRIDGQRLHDENVQRKVLEAQRHIESLLATLDEERSRHKVEIMTLEEQVEDQKLQEEKTQRAAAITNANQSREICELKTEVRRLNVQLKEAQKANDFHRALYDAARQYENALAALEKDVATRAGAFAASLETLADLDKFSSTLAEHYKNDMERLLELADTVQQRWREEHQPPPQEGNDRQHIDPPQTTTNNKHDHRTLEANTLEDTIEEEPLDAGALQQQLLEAQERLASLESQLKQSNDMHQEVVSDLKQQLEESRRREEKTRKEALNARATYDRDMCVLRAEGKRLSSQVEELVATTEATRRQSEAAELETRKQLEEARSQVKGLKTELKTLTMQRALECDGFDSAVRGLKENIKKLKSELDIARERSVPGGATVRHLLRRAEGVTAMAYAHINEKISLYLDCCTQWSEGQYPKSEKLLSNSIAELRSCMDLLLEKISQTSAQCEKERLNNEQQMKALQRLLEQQKQQPQQVEGSQHPPGYTRHAASGATGEGGADAPWLCCRCEAPLRGKLPNVAVAQSITRYSDILQDQHHKNTERLEQLNLLVAQVDELMTYGRSLPMFDRILSGKE